MKDGGPAFFHGTEYNEVGLTIRDYFAGQALMGMLAEGTRPNVGKTYAEALANLSYYMADAMIKERSNK